MTVPTHARIVIVGGGIAGCSTAYHLSQLGQTDVLLLEQGKLTSGTTWHAAGLVGQMRPNRNMTRMSRYGIELYARLEAETGLATGWKQCGSVNVAHTRERMLTFRKQAALARSFGIDVEVITPQQAGELYPLLRTDDLQGGLWIPGDGKVNPADLTMSLAKGARTRGVRIVEDIEVTGVLQENGPYGPRVAGVRTAQGEVRCEILVNCAGQWARQFARLAGVNVPLYSAEHFYIVTDRIEGVHPMLPVMRDPDGYIYYKEEVGGLVMGGFEPEAKPWKVDPIPRDFQFQLLGEDWDQFEILMTNAIHRTPCLETAQVKMLLNGPESFTPDGNFIIGEAPELRNCFVAAGFNSAGIANSGGAGRLIAEWIVGGEAPADLWDVDIRRFGAFMANRRLLAERTAETLGLHYAMRWPRQELETARPLRTSPLYDLLAERGAVFGSKYGWERANVFQPAHAAPAVPGLGRPDWLPWMVEEQRATREAVALYDQTSFGKLLLQGRDALAVLQRLCAKDVDVAPDQMVYCAMLNERGGFESDLTVLRLAPDRFMIVTGSGQITRDRDWITRHVQPDEHAVLTDVSTMFAVLSLMGPNAGELLARVSPDDLSPQALKFSHTREIDLGLARVRAARMSYVGGPGFELYVPVEMARHVYLALHEAGTGLGLRDAGYYALDALRIEAGRRAWGAELGPDENPFEAGLGVAVKLDKPISFIGQAALQRAQGEPVRKKLVTVVLDAPEPWAWGGETLLIGGEPAGELASVGWSPKANACVGFAYVRGEAARRVHAGTPVQIELWGEPVAATAWDRWPPTA
jgi:heterotetrameric sarcosine oxidase gamma subunit